MAESKVSRENYITVQGFMVRDLQLKGNELLIYSIIYGFSQADNQVFNGSVQYLADWTNSSKQSVYNCLKSLTEKKYIVKTDKIINGVKFCEYYATKLTTVVNKVDYPDQQSLPGGGEQSLPNNIDNNNLLNNIKDIIDYLNAKLGTKYSYKTKKTQDCIKARFNEMDNLTVDDFYTVIDKQYEKWKGTEWEQYLRPETLFGNKFEGYLNSKAKTHKEMYDSSFEVDEFFETALRRSLENVPAKTAAEDESIREKAEALKAALGQ